MHSRIILQRSRMIVACCVLLICLSLPACDEDPTETDYTELRISKVSGDGQSERTGAMLAQPLVVEVTNILLDPQQGIEVTFSSTAPGSEVLPPTYVTGQDGRTFCYFVLGAVEGMQQVKAVIETDSTAFNVEAVPLDCDEENPSASADWDLNMIYFVTTSSTLLGGAGSVLAVYDPETREEPTEILETDKILRDVSFSSRGELFVASSENLYKVNAQDKQLDLFATLNLPGHVELDANVGGILAGISYNGPFEVGCGTAVELYSGVSYTSLQPENLCADPVSRDLFFISGSSGNYTVYRVPWDGRSAPDATEEHAYLYTGIDRPRGMCIDYSGSIYVTIDGDDQTSNRRVIKIHPDGTSDDGFFVFGDYFENWELGRWGDITLLDGTLFLIDTEENRIVGISTAGELLHEEPSSAFSSGIIGETYGIAAKLQPPETAP